MNILKIILIAVAGAAILLIIKNTNASFSTVLRRAVILVVFLLILPEFKELLDLINQITLPEGISLETLKLLFKCFGVICAGSVASDICRDNGESGLGNLVDFSVKTACICMCLPVIMSVITTATAFMNG